MPRHYKSVGKSISTLKSNLKNLMKNVKRCLYIIGGVMSVIKSFLNERCFEVIRNLSNDSR